MDVISNKVLSSFQIRYYLHSYRFEEDIKSMTGRKISLFFRICWKFVSPALILVVLGFTFYGMVSKAPQYTAWDTEKVNLLQFEKIKVLKLLL